MDNINSIKESLLGMREELNRIIDNLKWLDLPSEEIPRTIDMYPAIITPRLHEELTKFGIVNVIDLANHKETEIASIPRVGIDTLRKLRILLECYGLRFTD